MDYASVAPNIFGLIGAGLITRPAWRLNAILKLVSVQKQRILKARQVSGGETKGTQGTDWLTQEREAFLNDLENRVLTWTRADEICLKVGLSSVVLSYLIPLLISLFVPIPR